jgi:IS30 family transposase
MTYRQITSEQRYMLAALRVQGLRPSQIARHLGCHRSTIGRELRRNCSASDGRYRASKAQELTNGRRSRSRRNQQFTPLDFERIDALLGQRWSPEQVAGARGMAITTAADAWQASATSRSAHLQSIAAASSATGRSTPSWGRAARTAS